MIENEVLKCDFCIKSFPNEETLSTHILSIHKSIVKDERAHSVTYQSKEIASVIFVTNYFHVKEGFIGTRNEFMKRENTLAIFVGRHLHKRNL